MIASRIRYRNRKRRWSEAGTGFVEFALVLPLFALLLFGMVDFGMIFGGFITLRGDVSAGARNASVDYVAPSCVSAANPMLCTIQGDIGSLTGVVPGSIEVAVSFPTGSVEVGQPVLVCAQATMKSTTGFTAPFVNGNAFHASSEARLEQAPSFGAGTSTTGFSC